MAKIEIDWVNLENGLEEEVKGALRELVDGAEDDLKTFGLLIAKDLVRATKDGNTEILAELGHQARALAEINRIRAVNTTWEHVGNVLSALGRVAMKAIASAAIAAV